MRSYRKLSLLSSLNLVLLFFISACDMPGQNNTQVSLPQQSGVAVPDVLLTPEALSLFDQGGAIYAVLNVYSNNNTIPFISQESLRINAANKDNITKVSWSVELTGELAQYQFEVQWKSTLAKALNGTDISFANSGKVNIDSVSKKLDIKSYQLDDSNDDTKSNYQAILDDEDPLVCKVGFSKLGFCRLG